MSTASIPYGSSRATATRRTAIPRKPYVARAERIVTGTRLFMLAATLLYLTIEIPFAAKLVDLLSTRADGAAVEEIERLGRFVSGAALALALWGRWLPGWVSKRMPLGEIAMRLGLVAVACVSLMMVGQRTLVDRIADTSSHEMRRAALRGIVMRDATASATAQTDGGSPKAMVGALPFVSLMSDRGYAALPARDAATRAYAERTFPSAMTYRDTVAAPLLKSVRSGYDAYRTASKAIAEATTRAAPGIDSAWNELQETIARRRLDVANLEVQKQIARTVRSKGFPVPVGWHPYDRAAFVRAGISSVSGPAEQAIRAASFGSEPVPAGLASVDAYAAHPSIQATIRKTLGLAAGGPTIKVSVTADALAERGYGEARKRFADKFAATLSSGPEALPQELQARGRDAVSLALAAAFGIVLSALGAAVHLCKVAYYAGTLALPRAAKAGTGLAVILAIALVATAIVPNAARDTLMSKGPAPAAAAADAVMPVLGWSLSMHGILQPAGSALGSSPGYVGARLLVAALPGHR